MAETPTGPTVPRGGFDENRQTAGYSSDQEVANAATILCEVSGSNLGQQAQPNDDNSEENEASSSSERRSRRKRKPVRRLSPLEEEPSEVVLDAGDDGSSTPSRTTAKKPNRLVNSKKTDERATKGCEHFCCDYCQSKFIIPPQRKKRAGRRSWRVGVRYWIDPKTNKRLRLCNACGLRASRNHNPSPDKAEPASTEERQKYFENVHKFSQTLISELNDPDAERLTCPYFRTRTPCACIQKFIIGDGILKDQLKFCEHATKRILLYSNNFLHKRLKTDPEMSRRLARTRGGPRKALREIDELTEDECCDDRCVLLAETHSVLLKKWGIELERADGGPKGLGEMLTPSGLKTNCYKFITMVTGCSASTIARVEEQMRKTGGDREPPPHD
ncbi:hypothetical protein BSL78_15176 [Apostichopus japonicus]|uniref:Uncharacterized protein n=1 Tax=Stichopus japonicus TaxID=307972 RepID=A0A2G8KJ06_STIJA|nr:hypothetical protein BSL78_15176 [Apostichopus japonicus]